MQEKGNIRCFYVWQDGQKGKYEMFYKVEVESIQGNNAWINNLYYQSGEDELLGGFAHRGADELAERFVDWVVPAFVGVYHAGVRVNKVSVYPFDDNFHLQTFLPYVKFVGNPGTYNSFAEALPPEQGLVIRFNLGPVGNFNFSDQPRRGRIFISGLTEKFFNNGNLVDSFGDENVPGTMRARLRNLCNKLTDNLSNPILPDFLELGEFHPVRAKSKKILGIWKIVGYSRIISADYSKRVHYLRSRIAK